MNNNQIKNCGECPFFEDFLEENGIRKGRCNKFNPNPTTEEEILETKVVCPFAETHTFEEMVELAFIGAITKHNPT